MIAFIRFTVFLFLLSTSLLAQAPKIALVESIENAHMKNAFLEKEVIQFDMTLFFGGNKVLETTLTMMTNSSKVKLENADGTSLLFDGEEVYMSPAGADYKRARFDMFTWSYFFAAPYKFSDGGTIWEEKPMAILNGTAYNTALLTFEGNVGDSPDDWYLAYQTPETNLLYAMAYIVTFGKSVDKANEEPHAISYENYQAVEGIPIATTWKFWMWYEEEGITDVIGEAQISNIHFLSNDASLFTLPEDKAVVPLDN